MRINIASSHRFHLLDLARELERLGHDVRFYSYVPTKRAMKFGLKRECSYSLFYIMIPFLLLEKLSSNAYWTLWLKCKLMDFYLSWFMKPCDVYIGLGYVYSKSYIAAKKRFGALTINDWGSKHNEKQWEILSEITNLKQQSQYLKRRVVKAYNNADYIAVPAYHVFQSFIEKGINKEKIIINPYGVDLKHFSPTKLNKEIHYDIMMVGTWSYVKGCDLIIDFLKKSNLSFLHVGAISDISFPTFENMHHVEPVDQKQLIKYYSQARVFILPSRTEGLAMVQVQAIACGLPIVCSKNTGGRDLRNFLDDKKWIIEMPEYTVDSLENCIIEAMQLAELQGEAIRNYAGRAIKNITWEAYGKRYNVNIEKIIHSKC